MKVGPKIGDNLVNYIQFADDLAIISRSPNELQKQISRLEKYCKSMDLIINTDKTEVMIFHKGSLSKREKDFNFLLNGNILRVVKHFKYLGFTFSQQLSFTEHLKKIMSKAKAKIGQIFARLKKMNMKLKIAKKIFECYVLPTFSYGGVLWFGKTSIAQTMAMESMFTKYLKRYLGISYAANNATIYYLTTSFPLTNQIAMLAERSKINLKDQLCPILPNTNLITLQASERLDKDTYFSNCFEKEIIAKIPSMFWRSIPIFNIPSNFRHRKHIITEALDLNHYKTCKSAKFHTSYKDEECIQGRCIYSAHWF